jgi:hypothetical protein
MYVRGSPAWPETLYYMRTYLQTDGVWSVPEVPRRHHRTGVAALSFLAKYRYKAPKRSQVSAYQLDTHPIPNHQGILDSGFKMHHNTFFYAFVAFVAASLGIATPVEKPPSVVKPFKVNLSSEVPRMLKLIQDNKLPDKPEYPGVGSSFGIDLDVLKELKKLWLDDFDWKKEQDAINR